ncbi:MAG: kelch repeat-containing protein [Acidobacteriota bacterium]
MAASAFRPAAFLGILAIARGASSSPFWRSDGAAPAALLARAGHAMTYDSARKRVVLFGGFGASYMNDTWEHDGISWTLQAPGPPGLTPRDCPVMAFDAARAKVILFGGDDSIVEYNDTWEYDAAGWTPGPAAPPGLAAPQSRRRLRLPALADSDLRREGLVGTQERHVGDGRRRVAPRTRRASGADGARRNLHVLRRRTIEDRDLRR